MMSSRALQKQLQTQGDKLNEDARAGLVKQIETKKKSFDRSVQDAQEDAQNQQKEIFSRILQKLAPVIVKYAQDNGLGMIVDTSNPWPQSPILWAGEGVRHHQVRGRHLQRPIRRRRPRFGSNAEARRDQAAHRNCDSKADNPQADRASQSRCRHRRCWKSSPAALESAAFFFSLVHPANSFSVSIEAIAFSSGGHHVCRHARVFVGRAFAPRLDNLDLIWFAGPVVGLLLLLPLLRPDALPLLRRLSTPVSAGQLPAEPTPVASRPQPTTATQSNFTGHRLMTPSRIPSVVAQIADDAPAPDTGPTGPYVPGLRGIGDPNGVFGATREGVRP